MLEYVRIQNFKSFKDFEIELDRFNCVIAPNNAGKSNLIEALRFLQYATVDVKKAIEEFEGYDAIKNIFLEKDVIEFECRFFRKEEKRVSIRSLRDLPNRGDDADGVEKCIEVFKNLKISFILKIFENGHWEKFYEISGRFGSRYIDIPEDEFHIFSDELQDEIKKVKTFPFELRLSLKTDFEEHAEFDHIKKFRNEVVKKELISITAKKKEDLLLGLELRDLVGKEVAYFSGSSDIFRLHNHFYAYSFYPEIIKSTNKGGPVLRYDGTNLVEVLNFIAKISPQTFEDIGSSLIGIVEELNDIKIDKDILDRNILLLKEKEKFLPFYVASDGTVNLLAIITAISEPQYKEMMAIDEIEKHLHLNAIDYILEVLKSQNMQILFTTQNPEIFDNLDFKKDNLIFLFRDHNGFTKAVSAKKIPNFHKKIKRYKDVSTIIKNEVLGNLEDFSEN